MANNNEAFNDTDFLVKHSILRNQVKWLRKIQLLVFLRLEFWSAISNCFLLLLLISSKLNPSSTLTWNKMEVALQIIPTAYINIYPTHLLRTGVIDPLPCCGLCIFQLWIWPIPRSIQFEALYMLFQCLQGWRKRRSSPHVVWELHASLFEFVQWHWGDGAVGTKWQGLNHRGTVKFCNAMVAFCIIQGSSAPF